jgi:hypothetical protein
MLRWNRNAEIIPISPNDFAAQLTQSRGETIASHLKLGTRLTGLGDLLRPFAEFTTATHLRKCESSQLNFGPE